MTLMPHLNSWRGEEKKKVPASYLDHRRNGIINGPKQYVSEAKATALLVKLEEEAAEAEEKDRLRKEAADVSSGLQIWR